MAANRERAQRLVARLAADLPALRESCPAGSEHALDGAILTAAEQRDPELVTRLAAVAGRVLGAAGEDRT